MATNIAPLVDAIQQQNRLLSTLIQTLSGTVPVQLPNYTVAALPATAPIGSLAYATNGRKSGEGSGSGTGCPVWYNVSGNWFAVWSSAQVTS